MNEKSISLADIESVLGVKITAAALPEIGERRIRIAFANGAKMVVVMSDEGKWQNAANFTASDGGPLIEHIAVLHGSMEVATPGAGGITGTAGWLPRLQRYGNGFVATIDARESHATHPAKNSVIVGLMSSDWQGVKRTADPAFDAVIQWKTVKGS